jgi:anti-sigma-K factor RskA
VVGGGGEAVLVLNDLPTAPAGKTYQAWIVHDETPVSAGTFESTNDQAVVPIPQAVPEGAVVAVTIEESGGASSPTLPPLAASEPV